MFRQELSVAAIFSSVSASAVALPRLPLMCAARSQLSKALMSEEGSGRVSRRRRRKKAKKENPSSFLTLPVFSLGCHSSLSLALPSSSSSPPFIYCFSPLLAVTLISPRLLSRLTPRSSLLTTCVPLQLKLRSSLRFFFFFSLPSEPSQFGAEPQGHHGNSPVPPRSARLISDPG